MWSCIHGWIFFCAGSHTCSLSLEWGCQHDNLLIPPRDNVKISPSQWRGLSSWSTLFHVHSLFVRCTFLIVFHMYVPTHNIHLFWPCSLILCLHFSLSKTVNLIFTIASSTFKVDRTFENYLWLFCALTIGVDGYSRKSWENIRTFKFFSCSWVFGYLLDHEIHYVCLYETLQNPRTTRSASYPTSPHLSGCWI